MAFEPGAQGPGGIFIGGEGVVEIVRQFHGIAEPFPRRRNLVDRQEVVPSIPEFLQIGNQPLPLPFLSLLGHLGMQRLHRHLPMGGVPSQEDCPIGARGNFAQGHHPLQQPWE